MDPQATLNEIFQAFRDMRAGENVDDSREWAVTSLRNLADWIEKGGFAPEPPPTERELSDLMHLQNAERTR